MYIVSLNLDGVVQPRIAEVDRSGEFIPFLADDFDMKIEKKSTPLSEIRRAEDDDDSSKAPLSSGLGRSSKSVFLSIFSFRFVFGGFSFSLLVFFFLFLSFCLIFLFKNVSKSFFLFFLLKRSIFSTKVKPSLCSNSSVRIFETAVLIFLSDVVGTASAFSVFSCFSYCSAKGRDKDLFP